MSDTYNAVAQFAQSWGLLYFIVVFTFVVAFVMWPSRRSGYEDAARIPFHEDENHG